MKAPSLELIGFSKRFGALVANDDISLDLGTGEVLALLGENGAGKSTLVSILFGHYVADAGSIQVFGHALPPGNPKALEFENTLQKLICNQQSRKALGGFTAR